jgi:hypothetical protein
MDNIIKYNCLYKAVCKAEPQASKQEQQKETNQLWDKIKRNETTYKYVTADLASKALASRSNLLSFWSRAQAPAPVATVSKPESSPAPVATVSKPEVHEMSSPADVDPLAPTIMISAASDVLSPIPAGHSASIPSTSANSVPITRIMKTAETPQQSNVQRDISEAQEQLLALLHLRDSGLLTEELKEKLKSVELNLKQKN